MIQQGLPSRTSWAFIVNTNSRMFHQLRALVPLAQITCCCTTLLFQSKPPHHNTTTTSRTFSTASFLSLSPNDGSDCMSFNSTFEVSQTFNFPTAVIQLSDVRLFVGCAPTRKSSEELERALSCFENQIASSGSRKSLLKPTV